jgi:hypothetical protein
VWNDVFKNKDWLESNRATDTNVVLIGANLDILSGITTTHTRPHLMLAAFKSRGGLQYKDDFLRSSLQESFLGLEEHQLQYQLKQLTLAVSRLDVPKVLGQDFCYLFSRRELGIQTRYYYYGDPERRIRTLCSQDVQGINSPITRRDWSGWDLHVGYYLSW